MTSASDIFDIYRETLLLKEEDCADFLVLVQDMNAPIDGAMAVAGLTLSLLENQWSKERMLLQYSDEDCLFHVYYNLLFIILTMSMFTRGEKTIIPTILGWGSGDERKIL